MPLSTVAGLIAYVDEISVVLGTWFAFREGTGDDSFADLFGHLPEQWRRSRKIESHPTPPAA